MDLDRIKKALDEAEDAISTIRWEVDRLEGKGEEYGLEVTPGEDDAGGTAEAKREAYRERVRLATIRARQGGFDPDEYIRGMTDKEIMRLRQFPTGVTEDQNLAIVGAIWRRGVGKGSTPVGHGMGEDGRQS